MAGRRTFESDSPETTEALATAVGRALVAGDVIALEGELGSGKTCFARGLARGLGIEGPVTSPTYTLLQSYDAEDGARLQLDHYDAYMEGRERAFLADGASEGLGGAGVSVIEWAERVADLLPEPRLVVRFEHRDETTRRLAFSVVGSGARADQLCALVATLELLPRAAGSPSEPGADAR